MPLWMLLLAAISLAELLTVSQGCSPTDNYKPPTLDWKMMNSRVVAHGLVLSSTPDPAFSYADVYSVQFELRCLYKGFPEDEVITINQVGSVPGHCISTELNVGEKYLVYLIEDEPGRFLLAYKQDPGEPEYLDEIVVLCETRVRYPKGRNQTHKEVCPDEYTYSDCVPQPVITSPRPEKELGEPYLPTGNSVDKQPASPGESRASHKEPTGASVGPGDTDTNVPYKAVISQEETGEGGNGSATLTWRMSILTCLVLSVLGVRL